jgi:hypothetical protein
VRLSRLLEYPELELSNNLAENAMRPIALGRRNRCTSEVKRLGPCHRVSLQTRLVAQRKRRLRLKPNRQ